MGNSVYPSQLSATAELQAVGRRSGRTVIPSRLKLQQAWIGDSRTQSTGFSHCGSDRRLRRSYGGNGLVGLPAATQGLVKCHELNSGSPPGDDVLGLEFELLSLGIEDVEEIRQPSL